MRAAWIAIAAALLATGCERAARNMYDGARDRPLRASPAFPDGAGSRPQVEGTIEHARGVIAATSSGRAGTDATVRRNEAEAASAMPYTVTARILARGHDRFDIYCSPCHSTRGDGDGRVVRRGFPKPPDFALERLRAVPDRHLYDVITGGYGVMYPYGSRIAPEDRWAIVAWVRKLQEAPR